jgi:hypothetical protein
MSVREQIYVRTDLSAAQVAKSVAEIIGAQHDDRDGHDWLLVSTGRLISGAAGEFGGPVLPHTSEAEFRPDDEFEAPDAYNVEIRLWQAQGPRIDPDSGRDVEAAAASALFATLAAALPAPMIHVRGDKLISAAIPGRGSRDFPQGTSIYDWDEESWHGFVVTDLRADAE